MRHDTTFGFWWGWWSREPLRDRILIRLGLQAPKLPRLLRWEETDRDTWTPIFESGPGVPCLVFPQSFIDMVRGH